MESSSSSSNTTTIVANQQTTTGIKLENPFSLKVGQVFTGFGIGCGLGIGVGRPLNLGAIPVLNQVMVATRGASDAFSGVGRHVNQSLRKLGAKNIEAGIGCGVGLGHGFGVGLAIKPGVVHRIQSAFVQAMTKAIMKFGIVPNLSTAQSILPASLQSGMTMINDPNSQKPIGSIMQLAAKATDGTSLDVNLNKVSGTEALSSKSPSFNTSYASRTEKIISSFLQNPLLEDEESKPSNLAERLQSENNMLQMVLKHQQVIEELRAENEKLRQILIEDLKIPPSKLKASPSSRNTSSCTDCFECRRKQRKR